MKLKDLIFVLFLKISNGFLDSAHPLLMYEAAPVFFTTSYFLKALA